MSSKHSLSKTMVFIEALLLVRVVRLAAKLTSYATTMHMLVMLPALRHNAMIHEELAKIVNKASETGPFQGSCLQRSAVLWYLLKRQQTPASIHVGVTKQGNALASHAWVECDTRVINDAPSVRDIYQVIEIIA